ncbi:MAG: ExeM/NucH family extracellular endonuclease [Rhodoferax sp.]|uniref:ExeM/NucH family extracellular endonuclease n=1 Tax=Rhodoferax sp. TaxID=50421 RepID=UPI00261B46F0|nr:ExeM/NucH family extracellular endonuclease [Rhodoferax sp.]MDD2882203.1 ExeM/NucH family extracellular endonuclease [Rhodoferax sp.]
MAGPTSVRISTFRSTVAENSSTSVKTPYAQISLLGPVGANNTLTLLGDDADLFQITKVSSRIYTLSLKSGLSLDFETNPLLNVTVAARDALAPASANVFASFAVQVTDVFEPVANPAPVQVFTPNAASTQGAADASTAVVLDGQFMLVGDDEGNAWRVYNREGGEALKEIDFAAYLGINGAELDLESSTRIGDTLFFMGSHGNNKSGVDQANREWLASAKVAGTGANTTLTFNGKFSGLEAALVAWDQSNAHGLGANHFGFAAATAAGTPESNSGFGVEGMTSSANGSALWIAFRAPVTGSAALNTALIVQLTNPLSVLDGSALPVFGPAIELDLGGRSIRSIDKNASGQYLVLAGPAGAATADVADDFQLYVWDGSMDANGVATHLVKQAVALDTLLADGASFEAIVDVPADLSAGAKIHLLQDDGAVVLAGQTQETKDLPVNEQSFTGNLVTLGGAATADVASPVLVRALPGDNATAVSADADIDLTFNEPVRAGSGTLVLKSGGNIVATFAANDPALRFEYNHVILEASALLQPGQSYTLEIGSGAIVDAAGNGFAGLTGTTSLDFATEAPAVVGTVLAAGELVFLAVNADTTDAFAFAILKDIVAGTQVGFTDRDHTASGFPVSGESAYVWTASTNLAAGTVVTIQPDQSSGNNPIASVGSTQGKAGGLSASAETIFAFQGSIAGLGNGAAGAVTVDHFVASINVGGAAAGVIPDSIAAFAQSFLPAPNDNVVYNGSLNYSDMAAFAAAARNSANYNLSDTVATPIVNNALQFPQVTKISAIQGDGAASAMLGQVVTIEARVTAWLPASKLFFVQEELTDQDGNTQTSEGIAVFYGTNPSPVNADSVGDLVRFGSTVTEYYELTELANVSNFIVIRDGNAASLDAPTQVTLPLANSAALEQFEGMLVEVSAASGGDMYVSDTYTFARYGELTFYADAVPEQYTQANLPSVAGNAAYTDFLARNSIQLDDGSSLQNPGLAALASGTMIERANAPLGADNFVRVGDSTDTVTGVLSYGFGSYELLPVSAVALTAAERPLSPDSAAINASATADIKVASFNVLNYFNDFAVSGTTTDNFTNPYGISLEPRGANNLVEFARQQAKIVEAIIGTGADVLALNELENNGFANGISAIDNLIDALNAAVGSDRYDYISAPYDDGDGIDEPTAGSDAIMVAIIYNKTTVKPLGQAATPDVDVYTAFADSSRPAVAQTFSYIDDSSKQFTLVANHFKSKGSVSTNFSGDADIGDGQGNNNPTRLEAAADLASWIATNPTGATDGDYLLVGDFNSYAKEDPIRYLTDASFDETQVVGGYDMSATAEALNGSYTYLGSAADYSYVFDGLRGSLDHALASAGLSTEVTGIDHWHINADEQIALDYNTEFNPAELYAADAYRASDHDPVVIGLTLHSEAGSPAELPPTPADTVAPQLLSSTPQDNAINLSVGSDVVLTFDEAVMAGSGTITFKALDGAADVVINVNGAQAVFNGATLTLNPLADLQPGKHYALQFGAGVVTDLAGNNFAGVAGDGALDFTTAAAPVASAVYISEIHYDNNSTDANERIAISGVAGTDLTGWSLVLYNGSGGAAYNTKLLAGTVIDDEGNGFGEVAFTYPSNGIQNGSPDGIALVNGTTVVQFLSYEGVMTAVGGAANGLTSTDIGATEGGTGSADGSIQLIGTTWVTNETANTFGLLN